MVTINGVENTVAPGRPVAVINGGKFNRYNGIRPHEYDKWRMVWNGNHFAPPEPNSVLYLPGVPGFGSTIFDHSGNGNNGTLSNATWVRRPSGLWGLNFDGDDYVSVPDSNSIDIGTSDYSLLFWFKTSSYASMPHIMSKTQGGKYYASAVYHVTPHVGQLYGALDDGGAGIVECWTTTRVDDGVWHLGVFTVVRSGNITPYLDGVANGTPVDASGHAGTLAHTGDLIIGANTVSANFFTGQIDLVRVFDAVLTAAHIADIYNQERSRIGV